MPSRRVFCGGLAVGVAAMGLPVSVRASSIVATGSSATPGFVLFDSALEDSLAHARRHLPRGLPTFGFTNDPSWLWIEKLAPRLRESPEAFTGQTRRGALFCLQHYSADLRLRLLACSEQSDTVRWVIGPAGES